MSGYVFEDDGGNTYWRLNDKLHRVDGPAFEGADGTKHWYINGKLHREDGPAIMLADGTKHWFIAGIRHREDGPAIEYYGGYYVGYKEWYLNQVRMSKEEFINKVKNKKFTASEIESLKSHCIEVD
jgi:hypothetical protein